MSAVIKKCSNSDCGIGSPAASFQDKEYGKGLRVMNFTNKGTKDKPQYRCTICLKIQ